MKELTKKAVELLGKIVLVRYVLVRTHLPGVGMWTPEQCHFPRAAWVTGTVHLQTGRTIPGSYDEPPAFAETGPRIPAWRVRYWTSYAEVFVPLDGLELAPPGTVPQPTHASEAHRAWARRSYANDPGGYPRDSLGRFLKQTRG